MAVSRVGSGSPPAWHGVCSTARACARPLGWQSMGAREVAVLDPDPVLVIAPEAEMRGTLAVAIAEETRRPVAAAPDTDEAARLARARRPGALVVDLGRDGDASALRALSHEPSLAGCPIVATGPAAARDASLAAGAAAFVAEPVDLHAVLAAVADALAGRALTPAGHADRAA